MIQMKQQLKPGDILVECWGYSMILYTFYKVLKVTDKSVWLQELTSVETGSDTYMRCWCTPTETPMFYNGEPAKAMQKILRHDAKGVAYVKTEHSTAILWDGKPRLNDTAD